MGILERKQRQMEETRNTILEQSWQIVEEEGWQALSIRKIAEAIEYSTPVVYKHFESKDAIIEEFTKQGFGLLAEKLKNAKIQHDQPDQQLIAISHAYWNFAFNHAKHYQIMFGLGIPTCEMIHGIDEMKKVNDLMLSSIEYAIESGKNLDADSHLKLRTFWSILHGLVAIEMLSARNCADTALQTLDDAMEGFIKALTT
ncbi:TetR/AcrR family transcriptional regulator [Parapedobacter tibetensis]|uniref:TetR/AcrR family transcriptional regulator n=1 Tax=Parapedobacter tibetensis TaxID=2972951 RepID=UPI00214D36B3|nr:TetR/AcrR family transcriptional regulator [Parapedobacter tibetensis]